MNRQKNSYITIVIDKEESWKDTNTNYKVLFKRVPYPVHTHISYSRWIMLPYYDGVFYCTYKNSTPLEPINIAWILICIKKYRNSTHTGKII